MALTAVGTVIFRRFGDLKSTDYTLGNTGILELSGSLRVGLNRSSYGVEASFQYIDAPKQDVTDSMTQIKAFQNFNNLEKLRLQYDLQCNQRFEFDLALEQMQTKLCWIWNWIRISSV